MVPTPTSGRLARLLPGLAVLTGYRRAWLRADLLGGLTVGAMLIPQCMAYAELAGLPPEAGFYAVLGGLVAYALLGTSRHLGVGPEPGTAILAAAAVGPLAAGDPARYAALMAALALVVAVVCFVAAGLRLGFLADLLSKPVLVGYITGVGITLLTSQLAKATGVPIDADDVFVRVGQLVARIGDLDPLTTALGAGCLVLILVLRAVRPTLPGGLIAVVLATLVTAALGLADRGVAVVGEIPGGLPRPALPGVGADDLVALAAAATGIALVGYSDNVLTARSIAGRLGYRVDANRELVALGAENLTSGLSQGFPVSSSASRTATPASLGTHTQLVGLVAGAFVVLALVFGRPLLASFPQPALAAVIIAAAIAIIDVAGFRELARVSRTELALAAATALAVIVFGVLNGVLVAVVLSVAVAMARMARPHDALLAGAAELDGWVDADAFPGAQPLPGLLVYRFDAPLFFVNANRFRERVLHLLDANPGDEEWVVLDFEGIGMVDTTAAEALAELIDELRAADVTVIAVARANDRVEDRLDRAGLLAPAGPLRRYPTINAAVRAFAERADDDEP